MAYDPNSEFNLPQINAAMIDPKSGRATRAWYSWFNSFTTRLIAAFGLARSLGSTDGTVEGGVNGLFIQATTPTQIYSGQKYLWLESTAEQNKVTTYSLTLLDDATAGAARTTLGATTVGANLFTLTNPSAVTFPRLNADNTVTARAASDYRTDLGLGTMAVQNASAVAITGGTVVGITDLAVADGGTGASDAAGARTNLGVTATGSDTTYAYRANNLSDLADAATARTNLGFTNPILDKASPGAIGATVPADVTGVAVTATGGLTCTGPNSTPRHIGVEATSFTGTLPGSAGLLWHSTAFTATDSATAAAGTLTQVNFDNRGQPTLAATNAGVITTTARSVRIGGAVIAGTNETITNSVALDILAPASLGGGGGVDNAYGFRVLTPAGATNNWAAEFINASGGATTGSVRLKGSRGAYSANLCIQGIEFASDDTSLTAPGTTSAFLRAITSEVHTASALGTRVTVGATGDGATTALEVARFVGTASAVSALQVQSGATGAAVTVSAISSETDTSLQLSAKGAGRVLVGTTGTATAVAGAATSNTQRGTVTSESLTTAAGASYTLTLTNSKIAAASHVLFSVDNGTNTTAGLAPGIVTAAAGSATIVVWNRHATDALNGTIKINFLVA